MEHREAFDQVGLLTDEPPGLAGLPFISSSDDFKLNMITRRTGLAKEISRHIGEVDSPEAAAAFLARLAPGGLDQDVPHGLGGGGEKVAPAVPRTP